MIFRILAAPVWPRGRVFALMAVTAMAATLLAPDLRAQTPTPAPATPAPATPAPKSKAAPKAAPKAPAPAPSAQQTTPQPPAAGAPPAQPSEQAGIPQLIYSPWTKFCLKPQDPNAKQICFTGKDGRIESGQPVVAAVIIEPEGEPRKVLRVTLPLGMLLGQGTRIVIDNNPPAQSGFGICLQNGCMSDYEVTADLLTNLKKGQNLYIQAISGSNNQPVTLALPLGDFAKAYDGPPTDPKVFEETQKKLQEELQKRAEEARKKLEANQPAAGASATPAAK